MFQSLVLINGILRWTLCVLQLFRMDFRLSFYRYDDIFGLAD